MPGPVPNNFSSQGAARQEAVEAHSVFSRAIVIPPIGKFRLKQQSSRFDVITHVFQYTDGRITAQATVVMDQTREGTVIIPQLNCVAITMLTVASFNMRIASVEGYWLLGLRISHEMTQRNSDKTHCKIFLYFAHEPSETIG